MWTLVSEKKDCRTGYGIDSGSFHNVTACAASCFGKSTMFIYARKDGSYCSDSTLCRCFCKTEATNDGTCFEGENVEWDLYSLVENKTSKYYRHFRNFDDKIFHRFGLS